MKRLQILTLVLTAALAASEATATPIAGEIFFTGSGILTGGATPATATGIDFANPVQIDEVSSHGDYAGLLAGTTASFTDLTGANAIGAVGNTGSFIVNPFWTFTDAGTTLTYRFALSTITTNTATSGSRIVEGTGVASITGLDDTPGTWTLSTSGTRTRFTFSSAAKVPDGGATISLLGLALLGVGVLRRRMR